MSNITLGIICGLAFGVLNITPMFSMEFPDKTAAITGAFLSRFAIGFLICNVKLPIPPWLKGLIVSLMISLPDAIITKSYGPILGSAVIGGLIIGWVAGRFEQPIEERPA